MRSLAADGRRRSTVGILLTALFLTSWAVWFCLARMTLYEMTATARLEVARAVYPIEAPVTGRIVATRLVLGQEVQAGDVLVELETEAQRLQLEEQRTRFTAATTQLDIIRQEIMAEEEAQRQERQAVPVLLNEARARYREAEAAARVAQEEADIYTRMQERGLASQLDFLRAMAEARQRRAAADALHLAISRLDREQRAKESDRQARLKRLKREAADLTGQIASAQAAVERPAYEMTLRSIRSPAVGQLGEVANVQIGAVVHEGETLGAVVSPGTLKVIAGFLPSAALGRIKPGQPARLRLEGFPWTQYGTVAARVTSVASEIRDKLVRVELAVEAEAASAIPFQHGLPGTVEVEVDRVSPATLMLRTAGLLLSTPDTSRQLEDDRRADR
jgi:membrane fusion protein (multidrug efflux system)